MRVCARVRMREREREKAGLGVMNEEQADACKFSALGHVSRAALELRKFGVFSTCKRSGLSV